MPAFASAMVVDTDSGDSLNPASGSQSEEGSTTTIVSERDMSCR